MSHVPLEQPKDSIAALEARALELQRELAQVQEELAALYNELPHATGRDVPLAPAWDAPIPISSPPDAHTPAEPRQEPTKIYLQSLQPDHALRTNWQLSSGLESAVTPVISMPEESDTSAVASDLRLFGLLNNGEAWERIIPFAQIAQGNGIILGRAPEDAAYAIEDASISRHHLQLQLDEYGLVVSDLGSTNGTAVNGVMLTPYDNNRPLNDGDTLSMGNIQLQIEFM